MGNRNIYFAESFRKSYRKLVRRNPEVSFEILECLIAFHQDPFTPKLKTHKLKGSLSLFYAFSVQADLRIIFRFDDEGDIIVVDIGSHDEVY
jgi:addiction module RelE/StbE family toxin